MRGQLPNWFRQEIPDSALLKSRTDFFRSLRLNTVCESANCPNIYDCFKRQTATFMILGNICTRNCRFCAVEKGEPLILDSGEPENIVKAAKHLGLGYVVITSVTRDDLPDGGAEQFALTIDRLHESLPQAKVEVLIPDFKGRRESLEMIVRAGPEVIGHNLETVPRLYSLVRHKADYSRSLSLISEIKKLDNSILTKSGMMVGMGEEWQEIIEVMQDLRKADCDILTIGQYLSPSPDHLPVKQYLTEREFRELENIALAMGFKHAFCAPKVRSSYHSEEIFERCMM